MHLWYLFFGDPPFPYVLNPFSFLFLEIFFSVDYFRQLIGFLWVTDFIIYEFFSCFFSVSKFNFFYKSAKPFRIFATLSSIPLPGDQNLSYLFGLTECLKFLYVLTIFPFFSGLETFRDDFLLVFCVLEADLLLFMKQKLTIKFYMIIKFNQILMNHVKFFIRNPFLASKMISTMLSDWGATQIFDVSKVDSDTYVLTSEKKRFSQQNYKTLINIIDAEISPVHILTISGVLATFGQHATAPFYPRYLAQITIANCLAIFVFQLSMSNEPIQKQYEVSFVQCMKYFGAFNVSSVKNGLFDINKKRGENMLDGGAPFYQLYKCKEGILAVGNLQSKFYDEMASNIGLDEKEKQLLLENQLNKEEYGEIKKILEKKFLEHSAEYWQEKLSTKDTCVTAMKQPLTLDKNYRHPFFIKPKL